MWGQASTMRPTRASWAAMFLSMCAQAFRSYRAWSFTDASKTCSMNAMRLHFATESSAGQVMAACGQITEHRMSSVSLAGRTDLGDVMLHGTRSRSDERRVGKEGGR